MKPGARYHMTSISIDRNGSYCGQVYSALRGNTYTKWHIIIVLRRDGGGNQLVFIEWLTSVGVCMHIDHSPRSFFLYPYLEYRGWYNSYAVAWIRFDGSTHPLHSLFSRCGWKFFAIGTTVHNNRHAAQYTRHMGQRAQPIGYDEIHLVIRWRAPCYLCYYVK